MALDVTRTYVVGTLLHSNVVCIKTKIGEVLWDKHSNNKYYMCIAYDTDTSNVNLFTLK